MQAHEYISSQNLRCNGVSGLYPASDTGGGGGGGSFLQNWALFSIKWVWPTYTQCVRGFQKGRTPQTPLGTGLSFFAESGMH